MVRLTKEERKELRRSAGEKRLFGAITWVPRDAVQQALDAKKERIEAEKSRIKAEKDAEWAAKHPAKAAKQEADRQRNYERARVKAERDAEMEAKRLRSLPPVVVRVYKGVYGPKAGWGRTTKPAAEFFESDAPRMIADGYTVASVRDTANKTSKMLMAGPMGYFTPDELTVTYVRQSVQAAEQP